MLKLTEKSIRLFEKVCGCSSIVVCPFCLVAVSILLLKPGNVKGTECITIIISRYQNKIIIIVFYFFFIIVLSNVLSYFILIHPGVFSYVTNKQTNIVHNCLESLNSVLHFSVCMNHRPLRVITTI